MGENNPTPTQEERERYEGHVENKRQSYQAREWDLECPISTVVSFDLQQILPYPRLRDTKQTFFKSRMICYNLCFFISKLKQGYCYLWSQVEGGRGSNEIATILKKFVVDHLADSRHIVFYSDGCPGQNKNQAVVAALAHLAHNSPPGQMIDIKYFETGHSHMAVDSVHACIERAIQGKEIATPGDYLQVIQLAKKTGEQPYIVEELNHSLFVDWKKVATVAFKPNALEGISTKHWISAENVGGKVVLSWSEGALGPLRNIEWRLVGGQFKWDYLPPAYRSRLALPQKRYQGSYSLVPLLRNRAMAELYFRDVRELVPVSHPPGDDGDQPRQEG